MKKFSFANFIIVLILLLSLIFIYNIAGIIIDNKVNDFVISLLTNKLNQKTAPDNVVLIAIDDKSIDNIDWPWRRDNFTRIFDYLENISGAKVIVFNNLVIFPDTYHVKSDEKFFSSIKNSNNLINTYILMNSGISDDSIPVSYNDIFDEKSNVQIIDNRENKTNYSYKSVIKLPKDFIDNVKYLASSILPLDSDDYARTYMPVVMYNNKFYPSVALSSYAMFTSQSKFILTDNYLCSTDNCKTLKMPVEIRDIKDNLGNKTKAIAAYYSWLKPLNKYYSHKTYSAIDVLASYSAIQRGGNPIIPPEVFKDKIVIIGLNAPNKKLQQIQNTPILQNHSIIDIQAVMIDNMLSNSFNKKDTKDYTPIITIIFCFLILRGFRNLKLNLIFTTVLSVFYLIYYLSEYMLGIYVPAISPVITMYSAAIFKTLYSAITTDKTAEMIKHAMGKYVSKDVMTKVMSNLDKLKLGGTRAVVTIFFVDIRNFTSISEELPPNEVTSILNEYFSTIEPIIAKYHGIVNKYIGDGLLAVFGEPVKTDEHAMNAVLCGIEIVEQVRLLREKFIKENKPIINIGIGVNTGEVFAGNIGTEERLEYTVIGDNVNLASRIEAYNQILKTQFLISEYTYEYVKDAVEVLKLSNINIKGKSKPIDIYEVLRLKNDKH